MTRYSFNILPYHRNDLVSDQALADFAEDAKYAKAELLLDNDEMTENPYWLVSGLSYEDVLTLASADCVKNFQRDAQTGGTKFWPGSRTVLGHLRSALKAGQSVASADCRERWLWNER